MKISLPYHVMTYTRNTLEPFQTLKWHKLYASMVASAGETNRDLAACSLPRNCVTKILYGFKSYEI
jgi:hypothetical protein